MTARGSAISSRRGRWQTAAEVLGLVGRKPGITRAAVARQLRLSTSSATEVTARLRELQLLTETPAPSQGRGRPTTVLLPHPEGPLVLAVNLRQGTWRSAVVSLDGALHDQVTTPHRSRRPEAVLASIRTTVEATKAQYGDRLRVVSLAAAGTIRENRLMQASTLGWDEVELSPVVGNTGLTLLAGNDATLSGVAESRTGAAAGSRTALHLIVEVGLGGTLIVDGNPVSGAGAGGEYGHLPFGDRAVECPCGARGCWDLEVDGRALARRLGDGEPDDPFSYAEAVFRRTDAGASTAIALSATALGSGIGGLVNAHDPDVITLGGLAVPIRARAPKAFATAYRDGLMRFHRGSPPPILNSAHEADGALRGAAALGLDHITTEPALAAWAEPSSALSADQSRARPSGERSSSADSPA